jgi:uncharacterized membrane protein SpoIIM required for sporulation
VKQDAFERARAARWARFEALLAELDAGRPAGAELPPLYRLVCQDLALAHDRRFGASLVARLNDLALRGHQALHGPRTERARPLAYLLERFPRAVRREGRLFAIASLLFFGSLLATFALDLRHPDLVYHVMAPDAVSGLEAMYDVDAPDGEVERGALVDSMAFAHYVSNNVGIAFRIFAGGLLFGIGSLLVLLFNGITMGAAAGHVTQLGFTETFYPFVAGHAAFELTAIVLSGVAGMRLGATLVLAGPLPRAVALRQAAVETVPILYGMTLMLLVAAGIEAFWSARNDVPGATRIAVGLAMWALVAAWLGLGGRRRAD